MKNKVEVTCKVVIDLSDYSNRENLKEYYDGDIEEAIADAIDVGLTDVEINVDSVEFLKVKEI